MTKKTKGKRKTQDPCTGCFLHKTKCMCDLFPSLNLKTKLLLVSHYKELKRTTNTGRMALKSLLNSDLRIRGEAGKILDLTDDLKKDYQNLLLYPDDSAELLTRDYIHSFKKPVQLIVPDGNWRQASKVHSRHKELLNVPRVKLVDQSGSKSFMRLESKPEGMATLQAIAYAFEVLEGKDVRDSLLEIYNEKLKRTLSLRGVI